MNFIEAIQNGFQNYVNFQGRSRRSAYWWWVLFELIILGVPESLSLQGMLTNHHMGIFAGLSGIIGLVLFLPSLGVTIRRLHDTNHSGWWLLTTLIPLAGFIFLIILIVWYCTKGTSGPNKYGSDPLGGGDQANVF